MSEIEKLTARLKELGIDPDDIENERKKREQKKHRLEAKAKQLRQEFAAKWSRSE